MGSSNVKSSVASPLAEQEGAPRHVGPDQDTGQRLGCGPSEADLCDRKGKPAFASGISPTVFTQFFPSLEAGLSAPCHPMFCGVALQGLCPMCPHFVPHQHEDCPMSSVVVCHDSCAFWPLFVLFGQLKCLQPMVRPPFAWEADARKAWQDRR